MSLLEFQRRMAADVMSPLNEDETMRERLDDGSSMSDRAAAYVKPNRHLSAFERLEIYNRQYWFRVLAALASPTSQTGAAGEFHVAAHALAAWLAGQRAPWERAAHQHPPPTIQRRACR